MKTAKEYIDESGPELAAPMLTQEIIRTIQRDALITAANLVTPEGNPEYAKEKILALAQSL